MLLRFYVYHPRDKQLETLDLREGTDTENRGSLKVEEKFDWTLRQASRTYQLWLLVLCQTLFWGVGCYILLAHQSKFAQDMGYNAMVAASTFGFFWYLHGHWPD